MSRYNEMFEQLRHRQEGALIPFFVLGYPDRASCLQLVDAAIEAGADALELGIPFSDPIADGPTIVAAANLALHSGTGVAEAFQLIQEIRRKHARIPIGLLVYANLVVANGIKDFLLHCHEAGADSLLVADMPLREADELRATASDIGIEIVFILTPNASLQVAEEVARASGAYVYLLSRFGVTGTDKSAGMPVEHLLATLKQHEAAPGILGFGISTPEHVQHALESGANGVVVGSGLVKTIVENPHNEAAAVRHYVDVLKRATRSTIR